MIPQLHVRSLTRAIQRDHFLVAAYDSIEPFNQHIVVVTDDVTEPSWVVARRTRNDPKLSNRLALAVPHLDALDTPLMRALTGVATDSITIRRWDATDRQRGVKRPGALERTS